MPNELLTLRKSIKPVLQVTRDGLLMDFLSSFRGQVDILHMDQEMADRYNTGSNVRKGPSCENNTYKFDDLLRQFPLLSPLVATSPCFALLGLDVQFRLETCMSLFSYLLRCVFLHQSCRCWPVCCIWSLPPAWSD